jgi:16S rRNA (guanine966-N2)-methyltransferase
MARLRIISGEFGGRFIYADVGRTTQPMGDRVRSALFNMIGVDGARVLDAYAGTGAVGLEALSRGAAWADFVEKDRKAQTIVQANIDALGVGDNAKLYKMSVSSFVDFAQKQIQSGKMEKYDVVFADPPYDLKKPKQDFSTALLLRSVVKDKGLMILSYPGRLCVPTVNGVVVVDKRSYGEAGLAVFRFES